MLRLISGTWISPNLHSFILKLCICVVLPQLDPLLCSVAVAQSASGLKCVSTNVCALRGSTVDIRCIYRKPSAVKRPSVKTERIMWFTEAQVQEPLDVKEDPAYSGRVKYFCDPTTCTLRIAALRESDSSVYKFAFRRSKNRNLRASPGVTLSVTSSPFNLPNARPWLMDRFNLLLELFCSVPTDPDLQVQVRRSVFTHAELSCRSACYLPQRPSYVWYKNGQRIQDATSASYSDYFQPADSVSCALSTHEDFPAPTVCEFICLSDYRAVQAPNVLGGEGAMFSPFLNFPAKRPNFIF